MNKSTPGRNRVEREARLRWVPISKMKVSPLAQRELRQSWVDHLASNFDLEKFGTPTVNERGDEFYIVDGQHSVEALRAIGWGDQQVQCWTTVGLTEAEEAEKFLSLNDRLNIDAFSRFRIGVNAGRDEECDIDRIVRSQDLRVSRDKIDGGIAAVGTLRKVYARGCLALTLRIVRDAYGDPGLEAPVLDGVGLLCQRFGAEIDEASMVERLSSAHGGVNALLGRAQHLRNRTGNQRNHCVAAAVVETVNRGRGGKKLPSWWRDNPILESVPA